MPLDGSPLSIEDQIRFLFWIFEGASPSGAPTGLPVNKGLTGSWFNPATPGQGFSLEIVWPTSEEETGLLILYWFTFHSAPELGTRWLFVDGSFEPGQSVMDLTVHESQGGRFDAANPAAELVPVGSAELRIMSCRRARFEYLINEDGESDSPIFGDIMLERLSPVDPTCLEMETAFVAEQS